MLNSNCFSDISPLDILENYKNIAEFQLSLRNMTPKLTSISSIEFITDLPLITLKMSFDNNSIENLDFLAPVFTKTTLNGLYLSFNTNQIE